MPLPTAKKISSPAVFASPSGAGARRKNAKGRPNRRGCASPAGPYLHAGANLPPKPRGSAAPVWSARFSLPRNQQLLAVRLPEVRRQLLWQSRIVMVRAAWAMIESRFCSLNAAAQIFGISASGLCVALQKFHAEGDEGLMPKFSNARSATACQLSFYLRP